MVDLLESGWDWLGDHQVILRTAVAFLVLLFAGGVSRLLTRVIRRTFMRRLTARDVPGGSDLERVKRQQTVLTLFESLVRYTVYAVAVVVAVGLVFRGIGSAAFGASLIVILVGFGIQRLLNDVVAGGLLVFEGQYAVGDVLTVQPQGLTGIVEEFALRTTTLRTFAGDRVVMLNGSLTMFTVVRNGTQDLRGVITLNDGAVADAALEAFCEHIRTGAGGALLDGPTVHRIDTGHATGESSVRLRLRAAVVPGTQASFEQAVRHALPALGAGEHVELLLSDEPDTPLVASHRQAVI